MRLEILIIFILLGCSPSKKIATTESRLIYFINYSNETAKFVCYTKTNEEDSYKETETTTLTPPGNYYYPHDFHTEK